MSRGRMKPKRALEVFYVRSVAGLEHRLRGHLAHRPEQGDHQEIIHIKGKITGGGGEGRK